MGEGVKKFFLIITASVLISCSSGVSVVGNDEDLNKKLPDEDSFSGNKTTGQLCVCDNECRDVEGLEGVCFYGICALVADSCEIGCPGGHICRNFSIIEKDICFRKWVVTDNITNCEGVSDLDFSCINNLTEDLDPSCSKYAEKRKCETDGEVPYSSPESAMEVNSNAKHFAFSCKESESWFKVTVGTGYYMEVCLEHFLPMGDIDLLLYDEDLKLAASRNPQDIDAGEKKDSFNTGLECLAVFAKEDSKTTYVAVKGIGSHFNSYQLSFRYLPFSDGGRCVEKGYTREMCDEILQFPLPDTKSVDVHENYRFQRFSNYRFGTRELIMAVRWAIGETTKAFENTNPLWIGIVSQKNGLATGADVGFPFSYASYANHVEGKAIDLAYYQKNNDNKIRNICREEPSIYNKSCREEDRDTHLVDTDKYLFLIKKLYNTQVFSGIFIVDQIIADEIIKRGEENNSLSHPDPFYVSDEELQFIKDYVYGLGIPGHNDHMHIGI